MEAVEDGHRDEVHESPGRCLNQAIIVSRISRQPASTALAGDGRRSSSGPPMARLETWPVTMRAMPSACARTEARGARSPHRVADGRRPGPSRDPDEARGSLNSVQSGWRRSRAGPAARRSRRGSLRRCCFTVTVCGLPVAADGDLQRAAVRAAFSAPSTSSLQESARAARSPPACGRRGSRPASVGRAAGLHGEEGRNRSPRGRRAPRLRAGKLSVSGCTPTRAFRRAPAPARAAARSKLDRARWREASFSPALRSWPHGCPSSATTLSKVGACSGRGRSGLDDGDLGDARHRGDADAAVLHGLDRVATPRASMGTICIV